MVIIFAGPPGAGKGTQARLVVESGEFELQHIGVGELLRQRAEHNDELRQALSLGALLPEEIVNSVVEEALQGSEAKNQLLDGYPRSKEQYHFLGGCTKEVGVVMIDVPEAVLERRVTGRYACAACGCIYNRSGGLVEKSCGACGAREFITRSDDNALTLKNRLAEYHAKTLPIIGLFSKDGVMFRVDGNQPEYAVSLEVKRAVKELLGSVAL